MTTRFSLPLFYLVAGLFCSVFLLCVASVYSADYKGPVFPGEYVEDDVLVSPPTLPQRSPLVQRPTNKQVVFDDLDPVGSVLPQGFLSEEEFEFEPMQVIRPNRIRARAASVIDDNVIFVDGGEYVGNSIRQLSSDYEGEMVGEHPYETTGYYAGPVSQSFGMSLFDNLSLFAETTAFKTGISDGQGSFGLGEGINWSTPVTPQGTITAQCGVRTMQGDNFSRSVRHQTFITAGLFKRCEFTSVQGGVAIDWLHDHSQFGTVELRQMRCELSVRSFRDLEYGFMGGFDVFRDRPTTQQINNWAITHGLGMFGAVDVQDYYLLFLRKHLDSGGQVELRCGATARGDFLMSVIGETAITDRLAVNGGVSMLAPSEGHSIYGNHRESWSMSLGIVFYFRGGAMYQSANLYRPMFDVAGNNSFFSRIVGR